MLSLLEEQVTISGVRTLSRGGRWLCSPRDPQREAADWLSRQKIHSSDGLAVVLGAGAGHHLVLLGEQHPDLKIQVIELDTETLASTKTWVHKNSSIQNIEFIGPQASAELNPLEHDIVLNFRPAWAGTETQYMSLYFQLTQNSIESFSKVAESQQLSRTSDAVKSKSKDISFSLKDLDFIEADKASEEVKFWKTLRELIE